MTPTDLNCSAKASVCWTGIRSSAPPCNSSTGGLDRLRMIKGRPRQVSLRRSARLLGDVPGDAGDRRMPGEEIISARAEHDGRQGGIPGCDHRRDDRAAAVAEERHLAGFDEGFPAQEIERGECRLLGKGSTEIRRPCGIAVTGLR